MLIHSPIEEGKSGRGKDARDPGMPCRWESAFMEIYDLLVSRAASIVGDRDEAKDVVHDVYVQIVERQGDVAVVDNLRGYIYGAVTNRAKMAIRRRVSHGVGKDAVGGEAASAAEQSSMTLAIDDLLQPLSPLQRDVVRLHDIEGYSCLEIALRLRRTLAAVKKQLALAHGKMKDSVIK